MTCRVHLYHCIGGRVIVSIYTRAGLLRYPPFFLDRDMQWQSMPFA